VGDDHLHAAAAERLRSEGQRYTAGRRSLVALLAATDRPVTIAELLALDAAIAQSSAYRNLGVLEAADVVHRVVSDDEYARYELAEDLTGHHHHHLICTSCGAVEDFTIPPALEDELAAAFERVGDRTGFRARHHRLDLVGSCATCR
jgi:Fe2+ or Zn2+ uptake regulation protein